MLRIPELKTNDPFFAPAFGNGKDGGTPSADHALPIGWGGGAGADEGGGAVLMGFKDAMEGERRRSRAMANPEYRAAAEAADQLARAVTKDAVTRLHQAVDAELERLAGRTGADIGDIPGEAERFFREEEERIAGEFADDRQKAMFKAMTGSHFAQTRARARALRGRRIREYREEATRRQNAEFVDQALAGAAIFDDAAQTVYRDMVLFNLDTLHADAPEKERRDILDAASRDLYRRILDRRLELDPRRMRAMLDAPAVRRVLGEEAVREYEDKAIQAIRDEEDCAAGLEWAAAGMNPEEAKREAAKTYSDSATRRAVLAHHAHWRHSDNRERCLGFAGDIDAAWRDLSAGGLVREAIPAAIHRNRPALFAFLVDSLERLEKEGGQPPETDYRYLAEFLDGYDPVAAMETLREEKELYAFMTRLGGPASPVPQAALRLLAAKATDEDNQLFADLRTAAATAKEWGEPDMGVFLARFVKSRRIAMKRKGYDELDDAEVAELINRCRQSGKKVAATHDASGEEE